MSGCRARLAAMIVAVLGSAVPAGAACTAPTPPDATARPVKPVPPVKGPCVDAPNGPGCKGWEPYGFNDEVRAFNAKVPAFQEQAQAYVAKLNAYVAASSAYAKCEVDTLR